LLRITLSQSESQEVALRDELEFVQRYPRNSEKLDFGEKKLHIEQV